jgi:transposase
MSLTDMYPNQGITGLKLSGHPEISGNTKTYHLVPEESSIRCPVCGFPDVIRKGSVIRKLRGVRDFSIFENVFLRVTVPKVACMHCDITRQIPIPFADEKKSYTKNFSLFALEFMKIGTVASASKFLNVNYQTLHGILLNYLDEKYGSISLWGVKRIAIDEIWYSGGKKSIAVVMDLDTGRPIYSEFGNGMAALAPFFVSLKNLRARIKTVAFGISPSYLDAVRQHMPDAVVVIDLFHAMIPVNDMLDKVWRSELAKADPETQKAMSGSEHLILKKPDDLNREKGHQKRLRKVLDLVSPLAEAYAFKLALIRIWNMKSLSAAARAFDKLIRSASKSNVKWLVTLAKTLQGHRVEILNKHVENVSSDSIARLNKRIRHKFRESCGLRNKKMTLLMVLAIDEFAPDHNLL